MNQKLVHIDSLRGIAILMVILVHTAQSVPDLPVWALNITKYGQLGVQLFFVVSAITLSISADQRENEADKTKKYFIRRFFRIAPLYYVGVFWYGAFLSARTSWKIGEFQIAKHYTPVNVLANLFFVHGFYPPAHNYIVPGGWSIGTEMAFYLLFPLLFPFFKNLSKKSAASYLTAFASLAVAYYALEYVFIALMDAPVQKNNFMYYNLLNQLPVFATGLFGYFFAKEHKFSNLPLLINLFFLFLFAGATYFLWNAELPVINSFMLVPFAAGAGFLFLYNLLASVRWLNFTVLQKIGQVSYSMYVFHFMFAWYGVEYVHSKVGYIGRPLILIGAYYMATVALAYFVATLSERYIEKPGIAYGKKIIKEMNAANKTFRSRAHEG